MSVQAIHQALAQLPDGFVVTHFGLLPAACGRDEPDWFVWFHTPGGVAQLYHHYVCGWLPCDQRWRTPTEAVDHIVRVLAVPV